MVSYSGKDSIAAYYTALIDAKEQLSYEPRRSTSRVGIEDGKTRRIGTAERDASRAGIMNLDDQR